MNHLENVNLARKLAVQEEEERRLSAAFRKASKTVFVLALGLGLASATDKSLRKLAVTGVLFGLSAVGFAAASEVLDMSADRAGLTSEILS